METGRNLRKSICFFVACFVLVTSCKVRQKQEINIVPPDAVLVQVIDYSELDGCQFLLQMENGDKLQPLNLPLKYQKEGINLFITYKIIDGISICMAGKMVQINYISQAK